MTIQEFDAMLSSGIVVLDGATGSNLRKAGMPVGVSAELWNLEHPEVLTALQRDYVEAGSQIVYAPTFMCNREGLKHHGLEDRVEELNEKLVALSRAAVGGKALVAGDMTTTGRTLEPYGDMSYADLIDVYTEQARALIRAGVDLIGGETLLTLEEASAIVEAVRGADADMPMMCTLTIQSDGSLMYGGNVTEAIETLQALGVNAVGLNCSVGPDQLEAAVRAMAKAADVPLIVKPNAGLPTMDRFGQAHYSMGPEEFARHMRALIDAGARVVGGCCGTDPEYIARLKEIL